MILFADAVGVLWIDFSNAVCVNLRNAACVMLYANADGPDVMTI